jgi:putative ABC transport system ATP-binding protein
MTRRAHQGGLEGPLIRLRSICKRFTTPASAVDALVDVDLDVFAGEAVALVGPSGSGKSTCVNIIGGLDVPTEGRVWIAGQETTRLDAHARALLRRATIGFVFQAYNLMPAYSVIENVMLPLIYRGVPTAERQRRAMEALRSVGLERWLGQSPSLLSGGQQQRVAIARALACRPRIIVADEPTSALDPRSARGVIELLLELRRAVGMTVLIVTHDTKVATAADRVVEFDAGRIISATLARATL